MLGGLISDEVQENVNKVPLLGDLPLIGALFRTTTDTLVKKNLMVFIPPVIIDSDKVAENVTRNNYSLMQELQEKYNSGKFTVEKNELKNFTEYKPKEKHTQ